MPGPGGGTAWRAKAAGGSDGALIVHTPRCTAIRRATRDKPGIAPEVWRKRGAERAFGARPSGRLRVCHGVHGRAGVQSGRSRRRLTDDPGASRAPLTSPSLLVVRRPATPPMTPPPPDPGRCDSVPPPPAGGWLCDSLLSPPFAPHCQRDSWFVTRCTLDSGATGQADAPGVHPTRRARPPHGSGTRRPLTPPPRPHTPPSMPAVNAPADPGRTTAEPTPLELCTPNARNRRSRPLAPRSGGDVDVRMPVVVGGILRPDRRPGAAAAPRGPAACRLRSAARRRRSSRCCWLRPPRAGGSPVRCGAPAERSDESDPWPALSHSPSLPRLPAGAAAAPPPAGSCWKVARPLSTAARSSARTRWRQIVTEHAQASM